MAAREYTLKKAHLHVATQSLIPSIRGTEPEELEEQNLQEIYRDL